MDFDYFKQLSCKIFTNFILGRATRRAIYDKLLDKTSKEQYCKAIEFGKDIDPREDGIFESLKCIFDGNHG